MANNEKLVVVKGEVIRDTPTSYYFYNGAKTEWIRKAGCKWNPNQNRMAIPMSVALRTGLWQIDISNAEDTE